MGPQMHWAVEVYIPLWTKLWKGTRVEISKAIGNLQVAEEERNTPGSQILLGSPETMGHYGGILLPVSFCSLLIQC